MKNIKEKEVDNNLKEIKKLFFYSIDNDLYLWKFGSKNSYYSPDYNGTKFNVHCNKLFVYNGGDFKIFCFFHIFNFKTWYYYRRVKNRFSRKSITKYDDFEFFENSLNNMSGCFIKQIRKEKLEKLD